MCECVQFAVSTNIEQTAGGIIGTSRERIAVGEESAKKEAMLARS